jgi:hypothetical protein
VLPAFAILTCRTDDVMRSETLTIGWQRTGAPKSRWCPGVSRAAISTVRRWPGPLPGSPNCAIRRAACAISGRSSSPLRVEPPPVSLPAYPRRLSFDSALPPLAIHLRIRLPTAIVNDKGHCRSHPNIVQRRGPDPALSSAKLGFGRVTRHSYNGPAESAGRLRGRFDGFIL